MANAYSTKRINVVLDQSTRDAVEAFAADSGLTLSKAVAFLSKEALLARGLLQTGEEESSDKTAAELFDEETTRMSIATDKRIAEKQDSEKTMIEMVQEETGAKAQLISKKTESLPSDEARMLKMKLMQELMEQLKSV